MPLRPEQHRILFSFIVVIVIVVDDDAGIRDRADGAEKKEERVARKGQDLAYKRDGEREREGEREKRASRVAPQLRMHLSDPAGFAVGCASFLSVPQPLCIMHPALRARPPILFIYFFFLF